MIHNYIYNYINNSIYTVRGACRGRGRAGPPRERRPGPAPAPAGPSELGMLNEFKTQVNLT